jgi:cell division transport system ATP-binding protein
MQTARFEDISIAFRGKTILSHVNFAVAPGEFVYLTGKTGAGKTSLLRLLYADLEPAAGKVFVDQIQVNTLTAKEIPFLRRKLGIVFQDFQLLNDRTVAQNLAFVLQATGWSNTHQIKARIKEVLNWVALNDCAHLKPFELSGGEQQRTALARALVNHPMLVLADEPTGNLDPEAATQVLTLLHQLPQQFGAAVLMTTHAYELINCFPARRLDCQQQTVVEIKN